MNKPKQKTRPSYDEMILANWKLAKEVERLGEIRAATIDECVKVVKDFADHLDGVPRYYVQEAAAKILALKDKK
jgi:hypothetical protein